MATPYRGNSSITTHQRHHAARVGIVDANNDICCWRVFGAFDCTAHPAARALWSCTGYIPSVCVCVISSVVCACMRLIVGSALPNLHILTAQKACTIASSDFGECCSDEVRICQSAERYSVQSAHARNLRNHDARAHGAHSGRLLDVADAVCAPFAKHPTLEDHFWKTPRD
jgi:hypothetical protein